MPYSVIRGMIFAAAVALVIFGQAHILREKADQLLGIVLSLLGVGLIAWGVYLPAKGALRIQAWLKKASGLLASSAGRKKILQGLKRGYLSLSDLPLLRLVVMLTGVGLMYWSHTHLFSQGTGRADTLVKVLGLVLLAVSGWPGRRETIWRVIKGRKPPFSWVRLPLLAGAIVLAVMGQRYNIIGRGQLGAMLLISSLFFLFFSFRDGNEERLLEKSPSRKSSAKVPASLPRLLSLVWIIGSATLFSYFAYTEQLVRAGLCLVLLLPAVLFWGEFLGGSRQVEERLERKDIWLLLAILVVAGFCRFYDLHRVPWGLCFDEGYAVLQSQGLTYGPWRHFFISTHHCYGANLHHYSMAILMKIFGFSMELTRWPSAVLGLLMVIYLYFLAHKLFGRRVAAIASFLVAVSFYPVLFSRFSYCWIHPAALLVPAIYHYLCGVDKGSKLQFLLAGVFAGLPFYFYQAFLGVPILFFFLTVYLLWRDPGIFKRRWTGLLVFGGAFIIAALPVLYWYLIQGNQSLGAVRQAAISAGNPEYQKAMAQPLNYIMANVLRYFLAFYYRTTHVWYNLQAIPGKPLVDVFSAVFLLIGMSVAVLGWRREKIGIMAVWLLSGFLPGWLSHSPGSPNTTRMSLLIPLVSLLVGLVIVSVIQLLQQTVKWLRGTKMGLVLMVSLGLVIGGLNYRMFFSVFASNVHAWESFDLSQTLVGRFMRQVVRGEEKRIRQAGAGGKAVAYISNFWREARVLPVYRFGLNSDYFSVRNANSLLRLGGEEMTAVLLLDPVYRELGPWLRSFYPNVGYHQVDDPAPGVLRRYNDKYNDDIVAVAYVVRAEDYLAARGLEVTEYSLPGLKGTRSDKVARQLSYQAHPNVMSARWRGSVLPPGDGDYLFRAEGRGRFRVRLNGKTVMQGELVGKATEKRLFLADGFHLLEVSFLSGDSFSLRLIEVQAGAGRELGWREFFRGDRVHGLYGKYYRSGEMGGTPVKQRIDPLIYFRWGVFDSTGVGIGFPFEVDWRGSLLVPESGEYKFDFLFEDPITILVDGTEVFVSGNWKRWSKPMRLERGVHDIRIIDKGSGVNDTLALYWSRDGSEPEMISHEYLRPLF